MMLHQIHDAHRHFAERILLQKLLDWFWWSTRARDVYRYCRSCIQCQMLRSLQLTQSLLLILHLQSLNLINIDYIELFTLIAQSEARYIIVAVDYFSCFMFAKTLFTARSVNSLEFLIKAIINVFEWSRTIYSDNGSHFTKRIFSQHLKKMKVRHLLTSVMHSFSVELIKAYIKLMLRQMRAHLQESMKTIFNWDAFVLLMTKSANRKLIQTHKYTSSELLFEFNAKYQQSNEEFEDILREENIEQKTEVWISVSCSVEKIIYITRLSRLDEICKTSIEQHHYHQKRLTDSCSDQETQLQQENLVLLRRLSQNNQRKS